MENRRAICVLSFGLFIAAALNLAVQVEAAPESDTLLTGKAAIGDWRSNLPGVRHKITVQDLPPPSSNVLAINPPRVARRPPDAVCAPADFMAGHGFTSVTTLIRGTKENILNLPTK